MNRTIGLVVSVAVMAVLSGCDSAPDTDMSQGELRQWVGKNVQVQFRRDALGAAASLPVSPLTGGINGASTTIGGQLMKVEGSGIVIGPEDRPMWIPREVILLVVANP